MVNLASVELSGELMQETPHFCNLVKQIGVEKTQWKEFNFVVKAS